mgnify:CR=1 FL=1
MLKKHNLQLNKPVLHMITMEYVNNYDYRNKYEQIIIK